MYYGPTKITDIQEGPGDKKTLVLDDGTKVLLSNKMIAEAVTNEPIDWTKLRDRRCFAVVKDILTVMLDWDIHIDEIEFVKARVTMSVNESLDQCDALLWNRPKGKQTMSDVDAVLRGKVNPDLVQVPSTEEPPAAPSTT